MTLDGAVFGVLRNKDVIRDFFIVGNDEAEVFRLCVCDDNLLNVALDDADEVIAANFGISKDVVASLPVEEKYIFQEAIPGCLEKDNVESPNGTVPLSFSYQGRTPDLCARS